MASTNAPRALKALQGRGLCDGLRGTVRRRTELNRQGWFREVLTGFSTQSERQVLARLDIAAPAFREARIAGWLQGHINVRQVARLAEVLGSA